MIPGSILEKYNQGECGVSPLGKSQADSEGIVPTGQKRT